MIGQNFLTMDYLQSVAHLGLAQRVKLMNTIDPGIRFTAYALRKAYRQAQVRFKVVKARNCWRRAEDELNKAKD